MILVIDANVLFSAQIKNSLTVELIFNEESHRYLLNGNIVPSVTQVINGVFPFEASGLAVQRSADFGKAVHKAIELNIHKKLNWGTVDDYHTIY